jgi:spore coat protein H
MKKIILILGLFFFSADLLSQTAGDILFNNSIIHTININLIQASYWSILTNNKIYDDANDSSTYISATVIIDGNQIDSVGIQLKGNSSYYNYPSNKKPFTLAFNQYRLLQQYDSLNAINLNNFYQDPAFMREKLFHDFMNAKGLYSPRSNYAKLYINGMYWGLYLMVERIDKTFLKDRFGNKGGNLFKGDKTSPACADLKYHGILASYYNCYTLKTNTTLNNWTDLINLTKQINTTTNAQLRDSLEPVMNTNSFIGAWAACNLFCDFDSYSFRYQHNYFTYHNTSTNKFEWITWDASTAFGLDIPMTINAMENLSVLYITPLTADRPLSMRMLADSLYKDTYLKYICSFANNDFLSSVMNPRIDTLYNRIKNAVYADTLKMYSNQNFDDNITIDINVSGIDYPGLKPFIATRNTSAINELNTLGYTNCPAIIAGIKSDVLSDLEWNIYPNPSSGKFIVSISANSDKINSISVLNTIGEIVYQANPNLNRNYTFDLSGFSNGIYFLQIVKSGTIYQKKIVVNK